MVTVEIGFGVFQELGRQDAIIRYSHYFTYLSFVKIIFPLPAANSNVPNLQNIHKNPILSA